jgi:hypothetical protein
MDLEKLADKYHGESHEANGNTTGEEKCTNLSTPKNK